ncbi:hypothetical protein TSAR_008164 [Trichomalopsis sarcophagae]|uniref:Uncharacterized protein n=1 Tax=Trichomalopsis sarcophagae TaxID=543379 RepID=A0A232EP99_9HYME|nr:hypothetical protein TSAR_008164 [Trichomalopsis sarcophagae]
MTNPLCTAFNTIEWLHYHSQMTSAQDAGARAYLIFNPINVRTRGGRPTGNSPPL